MCLFSWTLHAFILDYGTIRLLQLSLTPTYSWLGSIIRILRQNGQPPFPVAPLQRTAILDSLFSGLAIVDLTGASKQSIPACCSPTTLGDRPNFKATAD